MKSRVGLVSQALVLVLLGASTALAEEKLFTVSSFDDLSAPKSGTVVVDGTGKRYVVKDELFADLAISNQAITFGAELDKDGKTLDVHWVRAVVTEKIKLKDGTTLPEGMELKVFGKKDTVPHGDGDEDIYSSWHVILPNGKKAWLPFGSEFSIDMIPADSPVRGDRLEGLVHKEGQNTFIRKLDNSLVKVVGRSVSALDGAEGKWVHGYGLVYAHSGSFEFEIFEGGTLKKSKALKSLKPNAKKEELEDGDLTYFVGADKPGYWTVRHNWSGTGSGSGVSVAYIKKSDAAFACRWVGLTGIISKKTVDGEEIYSVKNLQAGGESFDLTSGSSNIGSFLLEPYLGKKVTLAGNVVVAYPKWDRGLLEVQWLETVAGEDIPATKDMPAIAKGTKVFVIGRDNQGFVIKLANGTVGHYEGEDSGFSLGKLKISTTPGLTSVIPGGP